MRPRRARPLGPNHAADPIVTRWDPSYPDGARLQVAAVLRKDLDGVWALPGGIVEAGEPLAVTMLRDFREEAGAFGGAERERMEKLVRLLFSDGSVIYRGYVDDPRNTDHAWIETTAVHYHCSRDLAARCGFAPADASSGVAWLDVDAAREPRMGQCTRAPRPRRDCLERLHVHVRAAQPAAPSFLPGAVRRVRRDGELGCPPARLRARGVHRRACAGVSRQTARERQGSAGRRGRSRLQRGGGGAAGAACADVEPLAAAGAARGALHVRGGDRLWAPTAGRATRAGGRGCVGVACCCTGASTKRRMR